MGKGDKKSKRGKIISGSYGVRRPKKNAKSNVVTAKPEKVKEIAAKKVLTEEKKSEVKAPAAKKTEAKKTVAKKPATKKEPAKKVDNTE